MLPKKRKFTASEFETFTAAQQEAAAEEDGSPPQSAAAAAALPSPPPAAGDVRREADGGNVGNGGSGRTASPGAVDLSRPRQTSTEDAVPHAGGAAVAPPVAADEREGKNCG